ncbi:hypothetical protein Bbelb_378340 [Branchiostoma belcheri]|nr:hypothetical protein Bbelb_378340 [Branchiostoma belcheri]
MNRKRKTQDEHELEKDAKKGAPPRPPVVEITIDKAVIKGYHIFRLRPLMGLRMNVVAEPDNQHDKHALAVFMPPLEKIPTDQHDVVTDTKRRTVVRDIAEKCVGHLPASLSSILNQLSSAGEVEEITCVAIGLPRRSFWPWPEAVQKGGGAVVPCQIHLQVVDKERATAALRAAFNDMGPEKEVLNVL